MRRRRGARGGGVRGDGGAGGRDGRRRGQRAAIGRTLWERRARWVRDARAWLADADAQPERALVLAGAASGMHAAAGASPPEIWLALTQSFLDRAQAELPPDTAAAAWVRGRDLTYFSAIDYALDPLDPAGG